MTHPLSSTMGTMTSACRDRRGECQGLAPSTPAPGGQRTLLSSGSKELTEDTAFEQELEEQQGLPQTETWDATAQVKGQAWTKAEKQVTNGERAGGQAEERIHGRRGRDDTREQLDRNLNFIRGPEIWGGTKIRSQH